MQTKILSTSKNLNKIPENRLKKTRKNLGILTLSSEKNNAVFYRLFLQNCDENVIFRMEFKQILLLYRHGKP